MEIIVSSKQQNMTQKYNQFRFRNSSLLTVHQLCVRGLRSSHLKGGNFVTLTDKQPWHNRCVNWHLYNNIIVFPMLLATFFLKKENQRLWNHKLSLFMSYPFPAVNNNNMADAREIATCCQVPSRTAVGLHGNVQCVFGHIFKGLWNNIAMEHFL